MRLKFEFSTKLAGENQLHVIKNVFNVLANHGFLRDQGVLTLQVVQHFYAMIREKPEPATIKVSTLLDVCEPSANFRELENQPVITLMKECSDTGAKSYHVVVLEGYNRDNEYLTMFTIDTLSETGETVLDCPILIENDREKLDIGGQTDQWCLGSEKCYALYLN